MQKKSWYHKGTGLKPDFRSRARIEFIACQKAGSKAQFCIPFNLQLNVGRIVKDLLGIIRLNIIQEAETA